MFQCNRCSYEFYRDEYIDSFIVDTCNITLLRMCRSLIDIELDTLPDVTDYWNWTLLNVLVLAFLTHENQEKIFGVKGINKVLFSFTIWHVEHGLICHSDILNVYC